MPKRKIIYVRQPAWFALARAVGTALKLSDSELCVSAVEEIAVKLAPSCPAVALALADYRQKSAEMGYGPYTH
jgi:hypothetical protein